MNHDDCGFNDICKDRESPLTGFDCVFVDFSLIDQEVDIEGLSKEDFPMELSLPFVIQNILFLTLYGCLALAVLMQIMVVEGGVGKAGMGNKHSVTMFVFLGCIMRFIHIYTSDLFPSLSPFRFYSYSLSAVIDIIW